MAAPTQSPAVDQSLIALQRLLNGPARLPPAGVIPNLDHPRKSIEKFFFVAMGLEIGFTTCAVIIRIYTKRILLGSLGYEDCKR